MDVFKDVRGKCRKKNPMTCRLHGRGARERYELLVPVRAEIRDKTRTRNAGRVQLESPAGL